MSAVSNTRACSACLVLAVSPAALAGGVQTLDVVEVSASTSDLQGAADSASEGTVTQKQLATRPWLRPGEVLETVPGLIVTQHSGDGKANQYFLRGFNLDHGTDFATFVLGAPVNMPAHAHGQGYTDVNFLIPELISTVRYRKGPYSVLQGDFASAGSASVDYVRALPAPVLAGRVGRRTASAACSPPRHHKSAAATCCSAPRAIATTVPGTCRRTTARATPCSAIAGREESDGFDVALLHYDARWTATTRWRSARSKTG